MKREICVYAKNDLIEVFSYKVPCVLRMIGIISLLYVFYLNNNLFLQNNLTLQVGKYQLTYFLFALSGIIITMYLLPALTNFTLRMQDERRNGTLEALLATPTRFSVIVISKYISSFIFNSVLASAVLIFGIYFLRSVVMEVDFIAIIVLFILANIIFGAIALLSASFIIVFEQSGSIVRTINFIFMICGGIYFPVSVLPGSMQKFSYLLPITYITKAFRQILFKDYGLRDIMPSIIVLLGFAVVLWTAGMIILEYCLNKARANGTLTNY